MTVLADYNLEGQAILLWGTLATEGWLNLLPLRLVMFHTDAHYFALATST